MALRLTGTTLKTSTPAIASDPTAITAQSLARQAETTLRRGEIDGYAGLFDQADAHREPQRRFEARLALLDAGIRTTRFVSAGQATRIFVSVADRALTMLEQESSEPTVLNLAGVALYELWSLDAAALLFKAARRLDPGLAEAERNLMELGHRRRQAGRRTRPLHAAAPGLANRARIVAKRAQPATGLTLSLCMIVRDEEQMLPRCLAAAAPFVDEIVIVDTGSKDATIEIARSFGARVIEHPWTGSFSEPRNISFEAATGDWVLYLDADEVLTPEDGPRLRGLTGRTWREAFYLVETSYLGELGDGAAMVNNALRMFRNRPGYRFKDRLHEQIWHTLPTYVPGRIEQTAVRVQHYGYLGSVRDAKEKSLRNVELLRQQAADSAPTPFLHFNLGSEYAAAGDPTSAVTELQTAREMLDREGGLRTTEYAPALLSRLVMTLRLCGRLSEARAAAADGLALFGDLTDLVLAQGRIAQALGDTETAVSLYHRCTEMGDAPSKYGGMVGGGTFLPRLAEAELHLERGDATSARAALQWCVENHPEFLAVAAPYATAMLGDGVAPTEVLAELERLDSLPPIVRMTVAAALRRAGATAAAIEQYRRALAGSANNVHARTELAELLLSCGEWDAAAGQADLVPVDDPYAALAARIALCGLIGRAAPDAVAAGLQRARHAGVPAVECSVFETWAAIAAGGEVPGELSAAGAPLLSVLLETLLRGRDAERFEALLPALERSRLEPRERHEMLAELYLSHGLLARAAQEWMAAAEPQPDARSLFGLARVAERHGMADDAASLATGALELDPQCAPAAQLLDRVNTARIPVAAA
jgi:tetratricopeptide (TPR) repeat protein